jgi:type IV secretory pathway ATPase VirB11/archaellum biosynthesis ATPase
VRVTETAECGETGPITVSPPAPPDDPDAWYAGDVCSQYEVHPGVVATISQAATGFEYRIREPEVPAAAEADLDRIRSHFADAHLERPRTREGATERMDAGFGPKYRQVLDRLVDCTPSIRRRINYHALAELRCLGELTAYALDEQIVVADAGNDPASPDTESDAATPDDCLVVHTQDFSPATTTLPPDPEHIDRFVSERLDRYTVSFHGFDVPVIIYREHVLGRDPFTTKYAVEEPDLLPGDRELLNECKQRIWEVRVDGIVDDQATFVRERAREFLSRRLTARNTRAWIDAVSYRIRSALAEYDLTVPPVDRRFADDRLSDLVYYVLRDYVGFGQLTVPIRDPNLEDIEANRVGDRIKVVPRPGVGHNQRIPTNLSFEDESRFVNVVVQLAAADGTELNANTPSAKVNLSPDGIDERIRCAVALPTISEDGPHISIRKQAADVLTPVDLVSQGSISTELVTLLWQLYQSRGVVLFSGPTGVGKTTLMNAHMPFIRFDDRPVSIDEGSREVRLPHETGVSLTTREHENEYKRIAMADLMTECNYLNPDVEVIAEINTPESFETFAEVLQTGHGVLGTTHAEDVHKLVNRVIEKGLPAYLLNELDVIVFPRYVDGDRYVGEVVEFVDESTYRSLDRDADRAGVVSKDGTEIYWNTVAWRDADGHFRFAYDHPDLGDDDHDVRLGVFDRLAERTDSTRSEVEADFHRKH